MMIDGWRGMQGVDNGFKEQTFEEGTRQYTDLLPQRMGTHKLPLSPVMPSNLLSTLPPIATFYLLAVTPSSLSHMPLAALNFDAKNRPAIKHQQP